MLTNIPRLRDLILHKLIMQIKNMNMKQVTINAELGSSSCY